ncbi:hypothetical protein MMC11_004411 [Xylographa trunciseda]|nr:hypothetical protein [Xylographa trunciseda]
MSNDAVTMSSGGPFDDAVMLLVQTQIPEVVALNTSSTGLENLATNHSTEMYSLGRETSVPKPVARVVVDNLLSKPTLVSIAACIVGYLVIKIIVTMVYRLYFHPLAKVPGPRIAAVTREYEFWYQGLQHTKFPAKIKELHKQYGPIVRISPEEISLNDSEFNIDYFMHDKKLNKDPWYYDFGFRNALFVLTNKEKHKERQTNLADSFRGSYWKEAYPMLTREIRTLVGKFEKSAQEKQELNLSKAFRKTGNDVLRNFLLGEHYDGPNAHSGDFAKEADTLFHPLFRAVSWSRHFPFLLPFEDLTPDWIVTAVMPMVKYKREIEQMIRGLIFNHDANGKPAYNHALLYRIVDHDPSYRDGKCKAAVEEFMELLWGGREVLGHSLTNICYHLMVNPEIMDKLHAALKASDLDLTTASYAQLQTIPYLWAVCKEGMRLQRGGDFRISRVNKEDVQYKDFFIPANTPISMSPNFFHLDEKVFSDADKFMPERWLSGDVERLEKFWNPFGNGTRSCGGRPMAYEIVFRGVANVFRNYTMEFSNCDAEYCSGEGMLEVFPQGSTTGLRVSITTRED